MIKASMSCVVLVLASSLLCLAARAQSPSGPIAPRPGVDVQQAPPGPQAKVKVQVSLVNTPVTVRDARGEMVHDLEAKNFAITDNGVPQKIIHFDLGGDPISLVILVESSSRIEPILPDIQKTGILLTDVVMGPGGEAAIVGFNDSVDKLLDFTSNPDQVQKTVARLKLGTSGLRLFDAMGIGVQMLSDRPVASTEKPGQRRVLLILSEANDSGSETNLGSVLRLAQLANVTIYSVGLSTTRAEMQAKPADTQPQITPPGIYPQPPMPGIAQTPSAEAYRYGGVDLMGAVAWAVQHVKDQLKDNPLKIATAGTGGAHLPTYKDRSIEKAIDSIGGELHSQYNISYMPAGTDAPGYHEIRVTLAHVREKNLKVRARPGYYLAPPGN